MRNVQKANTVAPMAATFGKHELLSTLYLLYLLAVLVWRTKHVTTIQESAGMRIPKKRRKTARLVSFKHVLSDSSASFKDTPGRNATSQYARATVAPDHALVPTNAFAQNF